MSGTSCVSAEMEYAYANAVNKNAKMGNSAENWWEVVEQVEQEL